ncbi:MAG: alpha/beta fold hydrolase [Bdellovibrionales bacterium]
MTLFFSLFISLSVRAQSDQVITLADQRQIVVKTSLSPSSSKPTFLFLPGIYRGFYAQEPFLKQLTARKINWVSIHLSRHPESILAGTPVFRSLITSEQLAGEVAQVRRSLKIQKPIVVSLSYTSSLIPHLNPEEFPWVIETAPMGRADENLPPYQDFRGWESWMGFFPGGQMWVASAEYWSYRQFWLRRTEELVKTHPRYGPQRVAIAEGFTQLAFSSRKFDLRAQDFRKGPTRFWILGEKEDAKRFGIQKEALQLYQSQRSGEAASVYIVPGAGHIIPVEKPREYVQLLSQILKSVASQ